MKYYTASGRGNWQVHARCFPEKSCYATDLDKGVYLGEGRGVRTQRRGRGRQSHQGNEAGTERDRKKDRHGEREASPEHVGTEREDWSAKWSFSMPGHLHLVNRSCWVPGRSLTPVS